MKKTICSCFLLLVAFAFSGCSKVIDLTDEESYLIAEYAAELLLKYDNNYEMKYTDEALATTEELTTEEITTEATTQQPADEQTTADSTTEAAFTSTETTTVEDENNDYPDMADASELAADVDAADFDLAEFVEAENVSIQYAQYMVVNSYPSHDKEGLFIEIEAPSGYKLFVARFDIENLTNEQQYLDMYSKDITYNLILNNKKSARQMLTILMDDLYTYEYEIDGSARKEAVLLFQVADSVVEDIENVKLKVTYKDKSVIVELH